MDDDLVPLRRVRFGPPKSSLKNANVESAVRNTIVPIVLESCNVVAVRSIFDFATYAQAVEQLAARRKKIEDAILKLDAVSVHCIFFND